MADGFGSGFDEISGRVEDLIFVNPENGFTVIEFQPADSTETIRAAGIMPELFPGEFVKIIGRMETHHTYGETFRVNTCSKAIPSDRESLITFLSCGLFPGVGDATAKAIVDQFGDDTADIILYTPERLKEVKKITAKRAGVIGKKFREYFNVSETLKFFADMNISTKIAMSVYDRFGVNSIAVTKRNPYHLIDEIPMLGFKTADRIALSLGVNQNSGSRLCAYIKYYLQSQLGFGNVCYPRGMLTDSVAFELSSERKPVEEALESLIASGSLRTYRTNEAEDSGEYVFLSYIDDCEQYIADRLKELSAFRPVTGGPSFEGFIDELNFESGFDLNDVQISAVKGAVDNSFSVITGGPGTGKTTIIKAVYKYLSLSGLKCMLCAPTGRAAKRMSEAVGIEARTIHRMLEYSAFSSDDGIDDGYEDDGRLRFNRNESNPLDADALIVDESSMLDTILAYHMLKALRPGSRLLLLGDKDQLPSVGPGNVLKDIIFSGMFPVTTLSFVYRQSDDSLIAYNAQRINSGLLPEMNKREKDFFMIDCAVPEAVPDTVIDVVARRLPKAYGIDPVRDIQVLIPGRKGECGVENINALLQQALNPAEPEISAVPAFPSSFASKPFGTAGELNYGGVLFRTGDRVMQIKNNYEIEWESRLFRGQAGKGIFNGEMGIILEIDRGDRTVTVIFDDDRIAVYPIELLSQLEHCYAITVHKSQGSEFDYCVIVLSGIPLRLCTRNILYTAVTRAKKMVVIIGDRRYIKAMTDNNTEEKRYTCLDSRLCAGTDRGGRGGQGNNVDQLIFDLENKNL